MTKTGLLHTIPPPPAGKTGWPWNVETDPFIYDSVVDWPKISIVTPSYNQGQYIEETIRSVILQNYPSLEFYILDGGSTDETINIIQKYSAFIDGWQSEPDNGQADAINKGFYLTTGNVFNWINSDDLLAKDALFHIGKAFAQKRAKIIAGNVFNFSEKTRELWKQKNLRIEEILLGHLGRCSWHQPGIWIERETINKVFPLDTSLHFGFDTKMIYQLLELYSEVHYINKPLVHFRLHEASKTVSKTAEFTKEIGEVRKPFIESGKHPRVKLFYQKMYEELNWNKKIDSIRKNQELNRNKKLFLIFKEYQNSPKFKINRFTLGAIISILANK